MYGSWSVDPTVDLASNDPVKSRYSRTTLNEDIKSEQSEQSVGIRVQESLKWCGDR